MGIPMYPSLSSHAGALTDAREIIPSLLRQMFAAPPSISDTYEGDGFNNRISFRRIMGLYGHNPDVFCDKYAEAISEVIARYFPGRRFQINTYYKYINDLTGDTEFPTAENRKFVRYTVFLDIQERLEDGNLTPMIISDMVSIDPKTFQFKIEFQGARNHGTRKSGWRS